MNWLLVIIGIASPYDGEVYFQKEFFATKAECEGPHLVPEEFPAGSSVYRICYDLREVVR